VALPRVKHQQVNVCKKVQYGRRWIDPMRESHASGQAWTNLLCARVHLPTLRSVLVV